MESLDFLDPAILKEIDRINKDHVAHCPCLKEEVDENVKLLGQNSLEKIKSNPLLRESASASLDVIMQNDDKAIEIVASKHKTEPCKLQTTYAVGLWNKFSEKYNIENPEVRILVSRVIVMCLRAYKMSGNELLTSYYDKEGNNILELHPYVEEDRRYSHTIADILKALDELENGKKITIKTELPSREELFGASSRYFVIDVDEEKK